MGPVVYHSLTVHHLVKLGEWQDAYDKASAFVGTLTTSEKISLITAGDAGNFTALNMLDSATNPLAYYYVTTWPAGLAMAMTWDTEAAYGRKQLLDTIFTLSRTNVPYS